MASEVPNSSKADAPSNAPYPWTTRKELFVTQCWIIICEDVTRMDAPHCLIGDKWTHIIGLFNHVMGPGQRWLKSDIFSKWLDLKEKVIWFNGWYYYVKNRQYYYVDDEEHLEVVKVYYMCERDGSEFEYEDDWNLIKNNVYFI